MFGDHPEPREAMTDIEDGDDDDGDDLWRSTSSMLYPDDYDWVRTRRKMLRKKRRRRRRRSKWDAVLCEFRGENFEYSERISFAFLEEVDQVCIILELEKLLKIFILNSPTIFEKNWFATSLSYIEIIVLNVLFDLITSQK